MSISKPTWRELSVLMSCLFVGIILLYWRTASGIIAQWRTSTFSHGFLIIPTSLYLAWRRHDQIARLRPISNFVTLPLLTLFAFLWLLGNLSATDNVQQLSLVAMIITAVWGLLGTVVARLLMMPLGFLIFAVPIGQGLIPILQDSSAWIGVRMLELSRIPVVLEGRLILVPSGNWEVAEACSGLRYLTASVAVGFLFAGLVYRTWIRRLGFFLASVVVPILANGFRVYFIVLLAYLSGNRIAAGVDHILYGWLFFTIVMVLLLSLGAWWRERPPGREAVSGLPADSSEFQQQPAMDNRISFSLTRSGTFAMIALVVVGLAPIGNRMFWSRPGQTAQVNVQLSLMSGPWHMANNDLYGWKPHFLNPDAELLRSYESKMGIVKLYVAYYVPTREDVKLVSSTNLLFGPESWSRIGERKTTVMLQGRSIRLRETVIQSAHHSLIVWNWYCVEGLPTSSEIGAKLLWTKARFVRDHQAATALVIAAEDVGNESNARDALRDFVTYVPNLLNASAPQESAKVSQPAARD